jgi:hypothetical protein
MGLRVIGAGVGRTGTTSLKLALEKLLGGRCYHMYEVFQHSHHIPMWHAAVRGQYPDWDAIYGDFVAGVDWPGAAFWKPLSEAYPDALVLLSVRSSAEVWFQSASETISKFMMRRPERTAREWHAMNLDLLRTTFTPVPFEKAAAEAAYERHNAEVRATVPSDRLLEWQVTDGWGPLCERLGVPVPDEPFPQTNTKDEFLTFLEAIKQRESRWQRVSRRFGR